MWTYLGIFTPKREVPILKQAFSTLVFFGLGSLEGTTKTLTVYLSMDALRGTKCAF